LKGFGEPLCYRLRDVAADIPIRQRGVFGDISGDRRRQEMIDASYRNDRDGTRTALLLRQLAKPVQM
jgi:hypothetical protein